MSDQLNKIRTAAHEKLKKESEVVVEVQKPSSLQTAAVDYLSRKEEPHPLSSPKNINESVTEGKMNDLHMYIKQGKTAKEIGKLMGVDPKTIQKLMDAYDAKNESVDLDEKEKSVRQLINPTKEVMIVKKNKVIVIDKKDQDKYMKQGWTLAEGVALEEARWKVKIEGLPPIYMDSKSAGEVRSQLRKLIKTPDMIQDIERVTDAEVKKALRNKISGKEVEEKLDKDDEDSVGDVVKQLKKGVKAHQGQVKSLTKDMQDELQVKEWFKAKNIDVKVRELDESTQVYVPLGRRIPNEIREELITTQYGKMPEDVKNVKDINYGNFMENSITMNNDFWSKVLHGTKGE